MDPDRWASSRFVADAQARADLAVLYLFDHELARAGRVASNPLLAEIRLTWWSEALDEIYGGGRVRQHPVAQALADVVARRGLAREPLDAAIEAWIERDEPGAVGAIAEAAALLLDPAVERGAAREAGAAWRGQLTPASRAASARLSAAAFPAVAHAAMRASNPALRQLQLVWAVTRGRL